MPHCDSRFRGNDDLGASHCLRDQRKRLESCPSDLRASVNPLRAVPGIPAFAGMTIWMPVASHHSTPSASDDNPLPIPINATRSPFPTGRPITPSAHAPGNADDPVFPYVATVG